MGVMRLAFLNVKNGYKNYLSLVLSLAFTILVFLTRRKKEIGVYLMFGGLIPLIFRFLAGNKSFLYGGVRILWINSMIFRMKKNYRTYAIVSVLMLCSVTALAMGFAMKGRYQNIIQFENTYTFQLLSNQADLDNQARSLIEEENPIVLHSQVPILVLDRSLVKAQEGYGRYVFVSYSQLKRLAENTGMELAFAEPEEDETVKVSHLYLLSLITERLGEKIMIHEKPYEKTAEVSVPYLGYLQESMNFYVLNDQEYDRLLPLGKELYTYNYRIGDLNRFVQTRERLDVLVSDTEENFTARVAIDPNSNEIDWIKVLYSICIFMFMVFILASGSILFMKLYNDALEEQERYQVLRKIGTDKRILKKSIAAELGAAYGLPFLVMGISSLFSVGALGKMMYTSLRMVNFVSVTVVFVVLSLWYTLSLWICSRRLAR